MRFILLLASALCHLVWSYAHVATAVVPTALDCSLGTSDTAFCKDENEKPRERVQCEDESAEEMRHFFCFLAGAASFVAYRKSNRLSAASETEFQIRQKV